MKKEHGHILILFLIIILSAIVTLASLYTSSYDYGMEFFLSYMREPEVVAINYAIVFSVMTIVCYLINSLWGSYLFTSLLFIGVGYGNYVKIYYRQEPAFFSDLKLMKEAYTMMSGKYSFMFKENMQLILILAAIIIIPTVALFFIKFKYKRSKILALIFTFAFVVFTKEVVYDDGLYFNLGQTLGLNPFIELESYMSKGLSYPLLYSLKGFQGYKYKHFNLQQARDEFKSRTYEKIPADRKVNVVGVMLESFKDYSVYEGEHLHFTEDPYKNFHKLEKEGIHGRLIVNTFGGGTFITESNVLTGFKHLPEFNRPTPSYVRYFLDNGYVTHAFHPYLGIFYNRQNVYKAIGFQQYTNMDNFFKDIKDDILSDEEFFPFILADYEECVEKNQPIFSFSVTYQNHGPYVSDEIIGESIVEKKPEYEEEWYNYFSNYISGIRWTDSSLSILKDAISKSPAPTVLILFGDHSPSAGPDNIMYKMLGINSDTFTDEGYENLMSTPYVIYANKALKNLYGKDFVGEGPDLEPAFLMPYIFRELDYKGNEYNQFLMDFSKTTTVVKDYRGVVNGTWVGDTGEEDNLYKKLKKEYFNNEYYMHKFYLKDKESTEDKK